MSPPTASCSPVFVFVFFFLWRGKAANRSELVVGGLLALGGKAGNSVGWAVPRKAAPSLSHLPGVCQDCKLAILFYPGMEVCLSFPRFMAFAPTAAISVPPPWLCHSGTAELFLTTTTDACHVY